MYANVFCAARFANRNLFSALFARCVQMKAPCAAPPAKCNSKLMSSTTMTTKGNNGGTWHFLLTHSVDIVGANWAARAPHRPYRVGIGRAAQPCAADGCEITWRCTRTRSNKHPQTQPQGDDEPNENVFSEITVLDVVCNKSDKMSYGE